MNYLATYTTILKEDRDACVADTSKANNGYYTSYPSPAKRALLHESSVHGKRLTVAVSFLMISLVCVAMVDGTLSCLVVLQAKQKPQVLHRNKRYVVQHKNRHNTCVFSLVFALFVPRDKRVRLKCNTSCSIYRINGENVF